MLAELIERRGADALDLAARQGGLQHAGRVDGALGSAGADQRMELVDEENDVLGLDDLLHHDLEALLELAAVLGARDERAEVEGHHAAVQDVLRHVGADDALGKALHDRCFADAGLADDDGIVLGPAGEYLEHPVDLVLPADHGVELAALGKLGEVPAELVEGGGGALFRRDLSGCAAQVIDDQLARSEQVHTEAPEDLAADPFLLADEAEEKVLAADIIVAEQPRFLYGIFEHFLGAGGEGDIAEGEGVAARGEVALHFHAHLVDVNARLAQDRHRDAVLLAEGAQQNVLRTEVIVLEPFRLFPGVDDDLPSPFRELLEHHPGTAFSKMATDD